MWSRAKYILLPLVGALAAIFSFRLSAPFDASLARGLSAADPASHFTYGTQWGEVNRIAFGALLCGCFCLLLTAGRQAWWKVLRSTIVGAALGGCVNYATDSGSDLIGILISHKLPIVGELVAAASWGVLVPAGIAFTVAISIGPTRERLRRAVLATFIAAFSCFVAQTVVSTFANPQAMRQGGEGLVNGDLSINLQAMLPVWRSEAIAVGVALGFTMLVADQISRAGTLRLLLGQNEYRDWSLDYAINRIGSSEGLEIPVWGCPQIAKQHAQVVRSGINFVLESLGPVALVNGQPTRSAILVHGDFITLGDATFVFLGRGVPKPMLLPRRNGSSYAVQPVPAPIALPDPLAALPGTHQLVDETGGHFTLAPGVYDVGREVTNQICLSQEQSVSRRHATISVMQKGAQVTDLNSSNGTKVNGAPISGPTLLRSGDRVEFGSAIFTFK